MQKIWSKCSKLDKITICIFLSMLVVMIVGLILIGTVSWTVKNVVTSGHETFNGFWILKNSAPWTIGNFITGGFTIFGNYTSLAQFFETLKIAGDVVGTAAQLQIGVILTVIFTPILLFISVGIFGYSQYLKKNKKA